MRCIKYLCAVCILFASCRTSRNTTILPDDVNRPAIIAAIHPPIDGISLETTAPFTPEKDSASPEKLSNETERDEVVLNINHTKAKKKVTSFSQMKEMAAQGEIVMSKKDLNTLNRLEKHYKGNYEQFRADTFEFTNAAKAVGGIGLLGLLLGIITGSAFGWFLFIVAALAFLLRYLNIIAF